MKASQTLAVAVSVLSIFIFTSFSEQNAANGLHKKLSVGGKSTISGNVSNCDENIKVMLFDESGYSEVSHGENFSFNNLYAGRYLICAKDMYRTVYNGNTADAHSAEWIELGDSSIITDVELDMESSEIKWVVFSGKVNVPSLPLPDAIEIMLDDQSNWNGTQEYNYMPVIAELKPDSTFSCTTLVPYGDYYVTFKPTSSTSMNDSFCMQWWKDGKSMHHDNDLYTVGRENFQDLNIVKTGHISGTLITDKYIQNAYVYAIDGSGFIFAESYLSVSNGTAEFSLNNLPDGIYYIAVIPGEQESFFYNGADAFTDAQPVEISNGNAVEDLQLKRIYPEKLIKRQAANSTQAVEGTVSGTVVLKNSGMKATNVSVGLVATETNTGSLRRTTVGTGSDNTFSISADTGDYYLYVDPSRDYYCRKTWYREDGDTNYRSVVHVVEGEEVTIDVNVLSGGSVSGWMLDLSNSRILEGRYCEDFSFGHVYLIDQKKRVAGKTILNTLSGFRFNGVEPGDYELRVLPSPPIGTVAGNSGYGYMTVDGVKIVSDSTSQIGALLPEDDSSFITGTIPSRLQTPEIVYAYDSDSTLCGFGYADPVGETKSSRSLFMNRLQINRSTALEFKVGPLPAGKYALARAFHNSENCKLLWIGGDSTVTGESSYYKVKIPADARWMELQENQEKSFSYRNSFRKRIASSMKLNAVAKNGRAVIRFSLPENLENDVSLSLFTLNGQLIKKFDKINNLKQVIWDGTTSSRQKAGSGMYIVRIDIPGEATYSMSFALIM